MVLRELRNLTLDSLAEMEEEPAEEEPFQNPMEGPVMLTMGSIGVMLNLLCLMVLRKQRELKLSPDYLRLLCAQSTFDLLYLVTSTPLTALQLLFPDFHMHYLPLLLLNWVYPFAQMTMTASIYTTIALAVERYLSIREPNTHYSFPVRMTMAAITIFSFGINIPRFFEWRIVSDRDPPQQAGNSTGNVTYDIGETTPVVYSVEPVKDFYTTEYFLGYNMVCSFTITMLIPVVTLAIFNMLIWRRLKVVWQNRTNLGLKEKRNTKACLSLIVVVVLFFICHSMKFVVSGYQLLDCLLHPQLRFVWPRWVEVCTFISHFFLAMGASVNILLYCSCDKRFFVVVQKTLKSWFIWPLTAKGVVIRSSTTHGDSILAPRRTSSEPEPRPVSV